MNDTTTPGAVASMEGLGLVERLREAAQGDELFGFDGLRDDPDPLLTEAADEIERLRAAITWALGANGDFRQQGTMDGAYWWRSELAERAGLEWDGAQYAPKKA